MLDRVQAVHRAEVRKCTFGSTLQFGIRKKVVVQISAIASY